MSILAIDQGTSSTRALLVHHDGRSQLLCSFSHRQAYPQAGWVEHDGEQLLEHIQQCLQVAHGVGGIESIGISNQGESCLAWDAQTGKPVSPVIVWQDNRTERVIEQLKKQGASETVFGQAGLPLDSYFSASKLAWIIQHIPHAQRLASQSRLRLGTTDAFFRDRLCGRFETDVSTASRTSLMNLQRCEWDAELCELFGVPINALPRIGASTGSLGTITIARHAYALCSSMVDQQAALYGHGCRGSGDTKMTFGTGAFALTVTGQQLHIHREGPLPTVAWQKAGESTCYALDGGVYAAASAVNWARELGLFKQFQEINQFEGSSAIARGLSFVPALSGLACPHWDRRARGAWMGLSLDTQPLMMVQAVLEGIAFRMAEVVDELQRKQSINAPISLDGGLSVNPYFCQFLATVLGREIHVAKQTELTAFGVAMLAAEVHGHTVCMPESARKWEPQLQPQSYKYRFHEARCAVQRYGDAVLHD